MVTIEVFAWTLKNDLLIIDGFLEYKKESLVHKVYIWHQIFKKNWRFSRELGLCWFICNMQSERWEIIKRKERYYNLLSFLNDSLLEILFFVVVVMSRHSKFIFSANHLLGKGKIRWTYLRTYYWQSNQKRSLHN